MSEDEVLAELRTIRTLLALDKEEELSEILENLSEAQTLFLDEVDSEWDSVDTAAIADEADVSKRTVQRKATELVDLSLVQKQGNNNGTEYRTTGLYKAADMVTQN